MTPWATGGGRGQGNKQSRRRSVGRFKNPPASRVGRKIQFGLLFPQMAPNIQNVNYHRICRKTGTDFLEKKSYAASENHFFLRAFTPLLFDLRSANFRSGDSSPCPHISTPEPAHVDYIRIDKLFIQSGLHTIIEINMRNSNYLSRKCISWLDPLPRRQLPYLHNV